MRRLVVTFVGLTAAACSRPPHNTDPGYAGHTQYFPLVSSVHTGIDCNTCHGDFNTFTQFSCTSSGCHAQAATDSTHANVQGYTYDSAQCYQCHPNGVGAHPLFPIGTASHGSNCSDCHADPNKRADLTTLQCAQCHASLGVDAKHQAAGILDYQASSPLCVRCHSMDVVTPIANHPTGQDTFIGNNSHKERCLTCHPGVLASPVNSAGTTWGADWASKGCSKCH